MTTIEKTSSTRAVDGVGDPNGSSTTVSPLLPPPPDGPMPTDDMQTAIAVLMIQASKEQRVMSDSERATAAKAQEEAHARKIEKMREIADATFAQGMLDGMFQLGSAGLQFNSARAGFEGACADLEKKTAAGAGLTRDAKYLDAASRGFSAAGAMATGGMKSGIEHDRADLAEIDREIDRAKSSVEGFATDSKRAQDDIRETMGFVRQYLATKAQLNQASVIRG